MRIYNNIPALQSYNALTQTNSALSKSISKLSSGLRINSAADDAAGLAISEKMRAQIRGLDRASANAQDGISMIQTAEGALGETTSILQRMRELSVQAANDTLTQQDRSYIQLEIDQLKEEINRIASMTQFNKKKLLDGSASVLWSSDSLDTKLFVRGGLCQVDQFGQKNVAEGNYKISITAMPGQAQIQKTDIFKIKHKNGISNLVTDEDFISNIRVDGLPPGNYNIETYSATIAANSAHALVKQMFGLTGAVSNFTWNAAASLTDLNGTAQILLEVTNVDTGTGVLTMKAIAHVLRADGTSELFVTEGLNMNANGTTENAGFKWTAFGIGGDIFSLTGGVVVPVPSVVSAFSVGAKLTLEVANLDVAGSRLQTNVTDVNSSWEGYWAGAGGGDMTRMYYMNASAVQNKDVHFKNFYINTQNGKVYESDIIVSFTTGTTDAALLALDGANIASFQATYIGQTAQWDTVTKNIEEYRSGLE